MAKNMIITHISCGHMTTTIVLVLRYNIARPIYMLDAYQLKIIGAWHVNCFGYVRLLPYNYLSLQDVKVCEFLRVQLP